MRMRLSNRGKYALHAMVFLAAQHDQGPQTLATIAQNGMPAQFLEQLLGKLRRSGLVKTVRGAQGGYAIARSPNQITLAEILEASEDPIDLSPCTCDMADCPLSGKCATQHALDRITASVNNMMYNLTLDDILKSEQKENLV